MSSVNKIIRVVNKYAILHLEDVPQGVARTWYRGYHLDARKLEIVAAARRFVSLYDSISSVSEQAFLYSFPAIGPWPACPFKPWYDNAIVAVHLADLQKTRPDWFIPQYADDALIQAYEQFQRDQPTGIMLTDDLKQRAKELWSQRVREYKKPVTIFGPIDDPDFV